MPTKGVANWVLPNNLSQDATVYKNNLDGAAAVAQRIVDNFAPHQSPQTADMTVTLDVGHIFNGSTLNEIGADFSLGISGTFTFGSNVVTGISSTSNLKVGMNVIIVGAGLYTTFLPANTTITSIDSSTQIHMSANSVTTGARQFIAFPKTSTITAPSVNPRIDRVVIDKIAGTVAVVTGSEAASPVPPAIPAYCCPIAQVLLQTSSTSITNDMITDERDLSGLGGASGAVVGDARNLAIAVTGNATATVVADEVVVKSALGGGALTLSSLSATLNAAGTGANGLDTGSLANGTFYYVYAIYNPSTRTAACLATTSISGNGSIYGGSNMPAGYTLSALIGVLLTDGSAHFRVTSQLGREVFFQSLQSIFSSQANVSTLTSQSIAAAVPPIARSATGILAMIPVASTTNLLKVAADSSGAAVQQGPMNASSTITGVTNIQFPFRSVPLLTSQTLFWSVGNTGGSSSSLNISSFTI